jgi:hypothetical protein
MKRIVVLSCIGLFILLVILLVIPRIFPPNPSDEVRDVGRGNAGHDKLMTFNHWRPVISPIDSSV